MEEPPILLDGARVIQFAVFDSEVAPTGRVSVYVGGVPLDLSTVSGVVLAENLVEGGVFLLHCNENWETLAAGHSESLAEAQSSAEATYSGAVSRWTKYRALSAEEQNEVETTRKFLRELAAEFPNE